MRFSGIRLLLVFVATKTIMILMLVPSMTSRHPWLALILPGQFQAGGNYSGYWVFFALVLPVDAITVIAVALSVLLPGLRAITRLDLAAFEERLMHQSALAAELRVHMIADTEEDMAEARTQMFVGRSILIGGAVFLVMAFSSVTLSYTRALPEGSMFVRECIGSCLPGSREVVNASVRLHEVQAFTLDQIARASLFGAPEIYDWHIGDLTSNPRNALFSHFVFACRLLFALILILSLVSLRLPAVRQVPEPMLSLLPPPESGEIAA